MQLRYIDQYGNSGLLPEDYEPIIRNMAKEQVTKKKQYTICVIEFLTDGEWWSMSPRSTIWRFEYGELDSNNNLIPTVY